MERIHLTKEYLVNWLENYALDEGGCVTDFVSSYLQDRYFNAQFEYLKEKDKDELINTILNETLSLSKRNIERLLEKSNTIELSKIILSIWESRNQSSKLDEFTNLPLEDVNKIFIDYIQDPHIE